MTGRKLQPSPLSWCSGFCHFNEGERTSHLVCLRGSTSWALHSRELLLPKTARFRDPGTNGIMRLPAELNSFFPRKDVSLVLEFIFRAFWPQGSVSLCSELSSPPPRASWEIPEGSSWSWLVSSSSSGPWEPSWGEGQASRGPELSCLQTFSKKRTESLGNALLGSRAGCGRVQTVKRTGA